jgi:hypothetical protein
VFFVIVTSKEEVRKQRGEDVRRKGEKRQGIDGATARRTGARGGEGSGLVRSDRVGTFPTKPKKGG